MKMLFRNAGENQDLSVEVDKNCLLLAADLFCQNDKEGSMNKEIIKKSQHTKMCDKQKIHSRYFFSSYLFNTWNMAQ